MENQKNWKANTNYWLNSPLRQVEDTRVFFEGKLRELVKPNMSIVDMGCGSGWLLDFLLELEIPFTYKGLDFTVEFIEHLNSKYGGLENVTFETIDLEENIPNRLEASADLVFNCFSFFEMATLDVAFSNAVRMLKSMGKLVILTIDPTYLALAVSHDMPAFKETLRQYEESKERGETLHFFQKIDLGDAESEDLSYASVLYSLDDYYQQAKAHGMRFSDYGEVVKTSKFLPKVYEYIVFER